MMELDERKSIRIDCAPKIVVTRILLPNLFAISILHVEITGISDSHIALVVYLRCIVSQGMRYLFDILLGYCSCHIFSDNNTRNKLSLSLLISNGCKLVKIPEEINSY